MDISTDNFLGGFQETKEEVKQEGFAIDVEKLSTDALVNDVEYQKPAELELEINDMKAEVDKEVSEMKEVEVEVVYKVQGQLEDNKDEDIKSEEIKSTLVDDVTTEASLHTKAVAAEPAHVTPPAPETEATSPPAKTSAKTKKLPGKPGSKLASSTPAKSTRPSTRRTSNKNAHPSSATPAKIKPATGPISTRRTTTRASKACLPSRRLYPQSRPLGLRIHPLKTRLSRCSLGPGM